MLWVENIGCILEKSGGKRKACRPFLLRLHKNALPGLHIKGKAGAAII